MRACDYSRAFRDQSLSGEDGRRARTRTWDPLLRRQMLYPTELRAQIINYLTLILPKSLESSMFPGAHS